MSSSEKRIADLQNLIEQAFETLNELEQSLLVSDEPLDRRRWKMQIKERRVEIDEWETELEQLKSTTTITSTTITISPNTSAAPAAATTGEKPAVEPPPPVQVQVEQTVVEKKIEDKVPAPQPEPQHSQGALEATLLQTLEGHTKEVTSLDFSSDGTLLASASDDKTIRVWQMPTGNLMRNLEMVKELETDIQDIRFLPKSSQLACATQTQLAIWNTATGLKQKTLKIHSSIFNSLENVAFNSDGTLAAISISNGSTQIWNVSDWSLLHTVKNKAFMVMGGSLAFSPDGQILATSSLNASKVWLWQVSDGSPLHILDGESGFITSVAISPDSSMLAVASEDNRVRLWRISDGTLQFMVQGHQQQVRSVAFSPNGAALASGSDDRTIKLWRTSDYTLLTTLEGHTGGLNCLAFSPDSVVIASGSDDKTVKLWQLKWP
jgi:WD40 repeat protein